MELGDNFYIDEGFNVKKRLNDGSEISIPWKVMHRAIELQRNKPLYQRADIKMCGVCGEPIHSPQYEKHMRAHGNV